MDKQTKALIESAKNRAILIGIDYDEGDQSSYRGVQITWGECPTVTITWQTGNPDYDYQMAFDFARQVDYNWLGHKSSADHFTMDGQDYRWTENADGFDILTRNYHGAWLDLWINGFGNLEMVVSTADVKRIKDLQRTIAHFDADSTFGTLMSDHKDWLWHFSKGHAVITKDNVCYVSDPDFVETGLSRLASMQRIVFRKVPTAELPNLLPNP